MRWAVLLVLAACGRSELFDVPATAPMTDGGPPVQTGCVPACDANADCRFIDGYRCVCRPGFEGDGATCTSIAATLDGLRWELPCLTYSPQAPDYVCFTTTDQTKTATLSGKPQARYDVRLRIRGVVETKTYPPAAPDAGFWQTGGTPVSDAWNVYALKVSNPAATHFLNHGPSGLYQCVGVDYTVTVRAAGGAVFTLFASAVDSNLSQIRNNVAAPIVVADVPPAPKAYDGQFLQMDVLGVTLAP